MPYALNHIFKTKTEKRTYTIAYDIMQAIWIERVIIRLQEVLSILQNRVLVWVNNNYTYLGKLGSLFWSNIDIEV